MQFTTNKQNAMNQAYRLSLARDLHMMHTDKVYLVSKSKYFLSQQ